MKQNKKYGLLFILMLIIFTISEALALGGNTNIKIEFSHNKLAVNIENVSLGSVLSKVQEKTGIKFIIEKEEADRIISVSFQPLPLSKALKRILDQLNHLILFGPNGNILEAIIIGKRKKYLKSSLHEGNLSSFSNTATIEPPSEDGMKINQSPDNRTPDGMKIFRSPENRTPDGMKIYQSPDAGIPDGMKISHSPDNRTPDGMKISHSPTEMK